METFRKVMFALIIACIAAVINTIAWKVGYEWAWKSKCDLTLSICIMAAFVGVQAGVVAWVTTPPTEHERGGMY